MKIEREKSGSSWVWRLDVTIAGRRYREIFTTKKKGEDCVAESQSPVASSTRVSSLILEIDQNEAESKLNQLKLLAHREIWSLKRVRYDVIGYWSEVKLEIVKQYATAYSVIMNKQPSIREYFYIDAFAGAGKHISKRTGEFISGSPLNALNIQPPFSEFHLIDLDRDKADELRALVGDRKDIEVYEEDANDVLLKQVFPRCRYQDYRRALCLLDPYKLNVDWNVIQTAGKMRSIELFYNFMMMDANMNVLWHNPDRVSDVQSARLDKAWGDHSWREVAYSKSPGLFGDIETKADNDTVAEAFRERLQKVAGFKYVPPPLPMRNDQGAVIYYLYFASPNATGGGIVRDIFNKYRNKGTR